MSSFPVLARGGFAFMGESRSHRLSTGKLIPMPALHRGFRHCFPMAKWTHMWLEVLILILGVWRSCGLLAVLLQAVVSTYAEGERFTYIRLAANGIQGERLTCLMAPGWFFATVGFSGVVG
jgi:hypothetical protein